MKFVPPAVEALSGCIITRLVIDDSVALNLRGGEREVQLRIDGRASLKHLDKALLFDPDGDPTSVGCLISLIQQKVNKVEITPEGGLDLHVGAALISIDPDEHQVSWSIIASDGSQASCIAEGKVVWQ